MSAPSAINNARQILVGAGTAATPVVLGTGRLNQAAFIANAGEVGIFTPEGLRIVETGAGVVAGVSVAAVAGMDFVTALSRGAALPPLVSDKIVGTSVTLSGRDAGAAATEESLAVGYNGTTGSIADVATYAGELYKVSILVHQFLSGTDSEHLKAGYYQSQLTDGQAEIALGIVASVNKNFSREVSNVNGDKPVMAEAICDNAGAAITGTATTWTVTRGSTLIAANGTVTNVAVGDYVRLGGLTPSFRIYKVAGIVSGAASTITLDVPYVEATATLTEATAVEVITAALGAAANWGIVLNGTPLPFNRSKKRYAKCRFDVVLDTAFGSTVMTALTSASEGVGTFEAISELENFLSRFMGESYEMGQPFIDNIDSDLQAVSTVAGGFYSLMALNFSDTSF